MSNKLFLVCPFSCLEIFIRQTHGDDIFFITAMATAFQSEEHEYLEEVKALLEQESITKIIIVNDTSCRFIKSVLKNENKLDSTAEKVLQEIFYDNYSDIIQHKSIYEQQEKLAILNIKYQAKEMLKSILFQRNHSKKMKLIGLVTTKASNRIKEININM